MPVIVISPRWPTCEKCGGEVRRFLHEPHRGGFERQSFTCSACGHVRERTVIVTADDTERLRHQA